MFTSMPGRKCDKFCFCQSILVSVFGLVGLRLFFLSNRPPLCRQGAPGKTRQGAPCGRKAKWPSPSGLASVSHNLRAQHHVNTNTVDVLLPEEVPNRFKIVLFLQFCPFEEQKHREYLFFMFTNLISAIFIYLFVYLFIHLFFIFLNFLIV